MRVLGIETSCDETSAAVVAAGEPPVLLAQVLLSQAGRHERFGGVVPEIACRSHVESLTAVIERCLVSAGIGPGDLDAIAVAHRPGLIGALLVGVTTAKALAWAWNLPLIGVHHLEAHLEAAALSGVRVALPYLGVVLSGGHTDIYRVDAGKRERLGATQDDALGEAFDKVASILGLGYPGGPAVERAARAGSERNLRLPRTLLATDSLDFSFSGIKTAVLYLWRGQNGAGVGPVPGAPRREDLAAAFQNAVFDVLMEKIRRALAQSGLRRLVFGGGVTANEELRRRAAAELAGLAEEIVFPKPEFSTDNGAMIAAMGLVKLARGEISALDLEAYASG
ncbi:MAG: tRNA (adenosine(37)-N6)-threonylcarbamoyltransferase complex transferase subunit TsaD [Planctomycetes bacterium]|nr:tRNA (adenosine(37)-N6)-threonylcarbamoyltransferase complex transferase subunit TsaD [Planctomycetota bacterium]